MWCTGLFIGMNQWLNKGGIPIATTRIISMHHQKGKSILQCLGERIDYSKNKDKTAEGEYISAYECDAKTAAAEFALAKREYGILSGREQKSNVIAHQIRQSFKPGEVTPEEANQIGYELAMRFLIPNSNLSQILGSLLQTIFTSTITNVFSLKQN